MSNELNDKIAEHFDERHIDFNYNNINLEELTIDVVDYRGNEVEMCVKCGNIICEVD